VFSFIFYYLKNVISLETKNILSKHQLPAMQSGPHFNYYIIIIIRYLLLRGDVIMIRYIIIIIYNVKSVRFKYLKMVDAYSNDAVFTYKIYYNMKYRDILFSIIL